MDNFTDDAVDVDDVDDADDAVDADDTDKYSSISFISIGQILDIRRYEEASELIVSTCQVRPRMKRDVFDFLSQDIKHKYTLQSGSTTEFYIEPIHSCIGDLDMMTFSTDNLVFTEEIPVLPDDVRGLVDTIHCYKIMPYQAYPGYVGLREFGKMSYDWHAKKFKFQKVNIARCIVGDTNPLSGDVVGPAVYRKRGNNDTVPCYWCPQWPKEAEDWPIRRREYGWPTTDTIQKIVQNGCHIVFAKHPACRIIKDHQWRLSFSGAEICLLQSWSTTQQIVYHLLRFFAKRELIKKDCPKDDEVLCNYHLKTLMLWFCEKFSPDWWNDKHVIEICWRLLLHLSQWLKDRYCPNYFIPKANLFYKSMNQIKIDETIRGLREFCNIVTLGEWFTVKYIQPILDKVMTDKSIIEDEVNYRYWMLRICKTMDVCKFASFNKQFSFGFWYCFVCTFPEHKMERSYVFRFFVISNCLTRDHNRRAVPTGIYLPTLEFSSRFPQFGKGLFVLFSVYELAFGQAAFDSDLFTELIREVSWQPKFVSSMYHNFPKPSKRRLDRSEVLLLKAQDLMENLTGLNSLHEFKLLSQVSKGLLSNVINCDGLNSSAIQSVALGYMAGFHFAESDYESAMDLCSKILSIKTFGHKDESVQNDMVKEREQNQPETLNAVYVFYIDYVKGIIGFYFLFRRIRANFPYNRRQYVVKLNISPNIYCHYSTVSSSERWIKDNRMSYDMKTTRFQILKSHNTLAIDLCPTSFSTQTRGKNDDKENCGEEKKLDSKKDDDEENDMETLNAQCLLQFTESESQIAIDLSLTPFMNQPSNDADKIKFEQDTLNAGCLLYIGDIGAIIGFFLMFTRFRDNFQCKSKRYFLDFRLTPEVFAHYVISLISTPEIRYKVFLQSYDLQPTIFPMDKMLTALTNRKSSVLLKRTDIAVHVYQKPESINESEWSNKSSFQNIDDLTQLLIEYSLETITSFYNGIFLDFGFHCNAVNCYRAAYLYKCRKYLEVLHLCRQILNEPDLKRKYEIITFANVMVLPPLDSYFDRDVQSLVGLHTLVCYLSPLNEELLYKIEDQTELMFHRYFAVYIYSKKLALSSVLPLSNDLKSFYFLRRHFLARYLRVRCLIDCSHSYSEIVSEFKKLNSHFAFEHIICSFLRQKLRFLYVGESATRRPGRVRRPPPLKRMKRYCLVL